MGQLVKTTYGDAVSIIGYNAAGQKTSMNDADMGNWTYSYDALGNLISQTDVKGQTTSLSYDSLNRLTGKTFSTGDTPITYVYDEHGQSGYRTSMTDGSGETHWAYDQRGRMVEEVKTILNHGTYTTQWRYDNQDRVQQMFYPNGELVDFAYNIQGEIVQIKRNTQPILANRIFDEKGRVIKEYFDNNTVRNNQYGDWLSTSGAISQIQTGLRNIENDFCLPYLPL